MENEQENQPDIFELLRDTERSRVRLAKSMVAAYKANAMPLPATPEDITYWEKELSDAELELSRLHDAHRT